MKHSWVLCEYFSPSRSWVNMLFFSTVNVRIIYANDFLWLLWLANLFACELSKLNIRHCLYKKSCVEGQIYLVKLTFFWLIFPSSWKTYSQSRFDPESLVWSPQTQCGRLACELAFLNTWVSPDYATSHCAVHGFDVVRGFRPWEHWQLDELGLTLAKIAILRASCQLSIYTPLIELAICVTVPAPEPLVKPGTAI